MSETKTKKTRPDILAIQWRLPADLVQLVRLEAAVTPGGRPCSVVETRLRESFSRKPVKTATA